MKFVADECVDYRIVERLRKDGNKVLSVVEMEPGISDDELLNLANEEEAFLLTADKDFGELVFRQGQVVSGIILIRLSGLSPKFKAAIVSGAITEHMEELQQAFTVITPATVRIRQKLSD